FQAEDGIRDRNVTGVQTCALPILEVIQEAIASTMPVPEKTPTSTPAARTIETTPTMEEERASISVAWSFTFGKLTAKASPEPTMKTNASDKKSATKATMTTTVSARLNQISFGLSVEQCGSNMVSVKPSCSSSSIALSYTCSSSSSRTSTAMPPPLPSGWIS